jgi:ribosome assembly protein 4
LGPQVRLWDPKTGQPLGQPLLGHSKWITSLSFEPLHRVDLKKYQSPRIASSSKDGTVRIWNTSTRKLEFVLTGHAASVNVVRWGGEGVIYTGSSDRTVKVWSGVDVNGLVFYPMSIVAETILGQTDQNTVRACALGQHHGAKYRLRASNRTVRSYRAKAQG